MEIERPYRRLEGTRGDDFSEAIRPDNMSNSDTII